MKNQRTKSLLPLFMLALGAWLALAPAGWAQPQLAWVRNGNSSYPHSGYSVAVGPDGSVVAQGEAQYYINLGATNFYAYGSSQQYDVLTARYSAAGELAGARLDGGHGQEQARGTALDAAGNLYSCGRFTGTAWFGETNVVSAAGSEDIFVAKYTPAGQLAWVVRAGSPGEDKAFGLALDAAGNVVVVGRFSGTMDFVMTNFSVIAGPAVFVAKYSPAGALVWATRLAGNGTTEAAGVAIGAAGESYEIGRASCRERV